MTTTTIELRRTVDAATGLATFDIPEHATDEQRDLLAQFLQPATPLWEIAGMPPQGSRPAPHDDSVIALSGVLAYDDYVKDERGQYVVDEETGSLKPCTTCVWLTQDGRVFSTHSKAASEWVVNTHLKLYGTGVMGQCRKVKHVRVEKKKTRSGYFTFQFRYMPEQQHGSTHAHLPA